MVTLTKEQIRSLYGVTSKKGEVVAFGRSVKNTITSTYRAQVEADARTVSRSELWQKHGPYLSKLKTKPAGREIEPDVTEQIF
jgi:hypothetical protein